jgi:uncharacterized repeat protein (TIGR01451 family)
MRIRNPRNSNGNLYIYNRGNATCNGGGIPCPAAIPTNARIRLDGGDRRYFYVNGNLTDAANNIMTYIWEVSYADLYGDPNNPIIDANTGSPLVSVQLNGAVDGLIGTRTVEPRYDARCVAFITRDTTTTTPTPTPTPTPSRAPDSRPNINITKTLVSPNYQPVNNTITFNIDVQNTGNVDINNFTLSDEYDPNYLEFVSASYRGQRLDPDILIGIPISEGRRRLTWSNMPPKPNRINGEDGVLLAGPNNNGEVFTLTLTFRILREVTPQLARENDNCGVVTTISYRDNLGQQREDSLNPPRISCVEFNTETRRPLQVTVEKSALTPSVVSPNEVRFRAVIRNTDPENRTYTDIDFTDLYDARVLTPVRVEITNPAGRSATVNNLGNNGVISIPDIQNLCAGGTNARTPCTGSEPLGSLASRQSYTLEIVFRPISSGRTCDTVYANIGDGRNEGGRSNEAQACAEITISEAPNTGADMTLNLIIPTLTLILSGAANMLLRRYGAII